MDYFYSSNCTTQNRMDRIVRALLVSVFLLAGATSLSHAQIGVTAGLNFEQTSDIKDSAGSLDQSVVFDNATGYHVGVVFEFGGEQFRLRPGVIFRNVGTYNLPEDANVQDARQNFDVNVIEVPLDFRLNVLPIPVLNPYVMAGPMLALPRGEGDFSDATREWSLSGNVGGGLSISVASIKIQPEFRYQFGITDYFSDSFTIGNETIEPAESPRYSAYSVRLSLMF